MLDNVFRWSHLCTDKKCKNIVSFFYILIFIVLEMVAILDEGGTVRYISER
jgi:hypothetical protein